jgi:hypothetical protein
MARDTGMKRRRAILSIRSLIKKRLISKKRRRASQGDRDTNEYVVHHVHHPSARDTSRVVHDMHPKYYSVEVPHKEGEKKGTKAPHFSSSNGQARTRGGGLVRLGNALGMDQQQLARLPDQAVFEALFEEGRREVKKRRKEIESKIRG